MIRPILELRGTARRFLLLTLRCVPSTAIGGDTLDVHGFDRKGRFERFDPTLRGLGARLTNPEDPMDDVVRLREGKYLDVSEWTGHFTLVLPRLLPDEYEPRRSCSRATTAR